MDVGENEVQVQNRISYYLARAMKSDVSSPVYFKEFNFKIHQLLIVNLEVFLAPAFAKGIDWRMFAQQEVMGLRSRIAGSFILNKMAVNRGLEVPGFFIGNQA